MATRGNTFKFDLGFVDRFAKKTQQASVMYDKLMTQRVARATDIIWRIAHQKRPMISKMQMKAEGRTTRVSDPSAKLGVPVRTGALQASVKQKVTKISNNVIQGEISTAGIKYAGYIEYGTSKMQARPFMRPAVNLTKEAIARMFGLKADSNLGV